MAVIRVVTFALLFVALSSANVVAGWSTSVEVAVGVWGTGATEFGISPNETYDSFPRKFYIKLNRSIVIEDIYQKNGRMKVYGDGQLQKITKCVETPSGDWNEECNILGDYLFTNKDGNIWTKDGGKYKLTAPTGELLATFDQKPLELGLMTARRRAGSDNKYEATVQYEDRTYHVILDREWQNFVRDQNDFLYFFDDYTAHDPVSNDSTV